MKYEDKMWKKQQISLLNYYFLNPFKTDVEIA